MTPLLLFLLGCAAIYLGTVSAGFNALMRLSLRIHAERTDRDDALGWYLDDPRRLFIPVRILFSIITVLATALLARVTHVDPTGFPILVLSVLGIILSCEHLIPLLIVRRDPERVLDLLLPSFDVVAKTLRPLTAALVRLGTSRRKERAANGNGHSDPAPAEAMTPVQAEVEAAQDGQARELLRNLADFRETMVREVMTPRPDIIGIDQDATIEQLYALFREQQYSRIPVFNETLDNVVGFVFLKDLIMRGAPTSGPIAPFMRQAHFVPETNRVPELLKEFQRKRLQSAIVVDEYGGTAGLVTVEDLLEEIVGEIRDEFDETIELAVPRPETGDAVVPGLMAIGAANARFGTTVPDDDYTTIGGYLFGALGRLPIPGDKVESCGATWTVRSMDGRRVDTLTVETVPQP